MHRLTESPLGHPPTDADRNVADKVLQELLHRIEVGNANAAAYPARGHYTFLVSHAWIDGSSIRLVYTTAPSDRTWGLARDTRRSLINPSPWNETDDPALYYYLLDLEENWPGNHSREQGEDADLIWWSGYPLTDLPDRRSGVSGTHRYLPPPTNPSWVDHTPAPLVEPRRYANPT